MCQRYYPIPFDQLKSAFSTEPLWFSCHSSHSHLLKSRPCDGAGSGNVLTVLDEMGATNLSAVRLAVSQNERPPPLPLCKPTAGAQATMYACGRTDAVSIVPSGGGGGGTYHRIQIEATKLCLLSSRGNSSWGTCKAADQSQDWVLDQPHGTGAIHPRGEHAKCLDVFGQSKSVGTPIDVWRCNGGENQEWALKAGGLVSSFSQLCLSSC